MSNSGKVLFNGFVSSKSKKSNNKNNRNIRKISREEIQRIKNQSVKKYDNKHKIFNISRNKLRQKYRNNYNNTGNKRYFIKNNEIINKSKNNQNNINSSSSKVLFSNANSNSSSNYYDILDNYNFSDGLNVIKSVNLNGKNIKSITTSKSTVKLITLKDTTGCDLNFIFNIEGGPQGEQGPDGKSPTSIYTLGQDVGTTSDVTFNTVEATNPSSYSLNGVTVTSTEWGYLVNMDQYLATTSDVTFNSVTATTSYSLGSTTIDATQWNRLAIIDQDLGTTADVEFNSLSLPGGTTSSNDTFIFRSNNNRIWSNTNNQMRFILQGGGIGTMFFNLGNLWPINNTLDLGLSNLAWKTVYLGTSIILNGTTIGTTQWNNISSLPLNTTSDVIFNSVSVPTSAKLILDGGANKVSFSAINAGVIRIRLGNAGAPKYFIRGNLFEPQATTTLVSLGKTAQRWKDLYLSEKANVAQLNISTPTVPASAGASGTTGDIEWGTDYLYVSIGTDTWKRLALSTW